MTRKQKKLTRTKKLMFVSHKIPESWYPYIQGRLFLLINWQFSCILSIVLPGEHYISILLYYEQHLPKFPKDSLKVLKNPQNTPENVKSLDLSPNAPKSPNLG